MLYRFPYDHRCEAIMIQESDLANAPNANRLRRKLASSKKRVSFNGETGAHAFDNYVKERRLFDDLLQKVKATSSVRQAVVAGTPVLPEQLAVYGCYACEHFRTQPETGFFAVYLLALEGDNAYVGHRLTIYKVAVSALYTIQE
jgi:hypothetical protein